jgi:hypothetical protein
LLLEELGMRPIQWDEGRVDGKNCDERESPSKMRAGLPKFEAS